MESLPRHELWRKQYREDRYLEHLSEKELYDRCSHTMSNLLTLESNGKIGMLSHKVPNAERFVIKFTQVLEELGLRGKGLIPGLLDSVPTPEPTIKFCEAFQKLKSKYGRDNGYLFKFGQSKFLSKYSFKIALASSYEKHTNLSIQDSELKAELTPPPGEFTMHGPDGQEIKGIKNVRLNYSTNWDYYIFCTSHRLDFRLFNDFEADSCLIIKDRTAFSNELGKAVNKIVSLEQMEYGLVEYFDPVRHDRKGEPRIQFHKHFKYFYQNEHRHAFTPRTQSSLKEELVFELPSVAKYCELVEL